MLFSTRDQRNVISNQPQLRLGEQNTRAVLDGHIHVYIPCHGHGRCAFQQCCLEGHARFSSATYVLFAVDRTYADSCHRAPTNVLLITRCRCASFLARPIDVLYIDPTKQHNTPAGQTMWATHHGVDSLFRYCGVVVNSFATTTNSSSSKDQCVAAKVSSSETTKDFSRRPCCRPL